MVPRDPLSSKHRSSERTVRTSSDIDLSSQKSHQKRDIGLVGGASNCQHISSLFFFSTRQERGRIPRTFQQVRVTKKTCRPWWWGDRGKVGGDWEGGGYIKRRVEWPRATMALPLRFLFSQDPGRRRRGKHCFPFEALHCVHPRRQRLRNRRST